MLRLSVGGWFAERAADERKQSSHLAPQDERKAGAGTRNFRALKPSGTAASPHGLWQPCWREPPLTFEGVVDLRPGDSEAGIEAESFATAAGCGMKAAAGFRSPKRLLPPLLFWQESRIPPHPCADAVTQAPFSRPSRAQPGFEGFHTSSIRWLSLAEARFTNRLFSREPPARSSSMHSVPRPNRTSHPTFSPSRRLERNEPGVKRAKRV
jgi:hypothetical protein